MHSLFYGSNIKKSQSRFMKIYNYIFLFDQILQAVTPVDGENDIAVSV